MSSTEIDNIAFDGYRIFRKQEEALKDNPNFRILVTNKKERLILILKLLTKKRGFI